MSNFSDKSNVEKALLAGMHGVELRRDEKRRYLGFFRERVIQAVTFNQLRTKQGMEVMVKALKDKRAVELVIHQNARGTAMPLIIEAQRKGLDFTIVSDPKFIGDVAVVLAARDAVDVPQVMAEK